MKTYFTNLSEYFLISTRFLLLFFFFLILKNVDGQTNVSGGIHSNTTWTLANSPYIVTDNIVVFPGNILTIEPGVVVKFDQDKSIEMREAKMIATGTSTDAIVFTSNLSSPVAGSWKGIILNDNSTPSNYRVLEFNYCKFSYAENGLNAIRYATFDSLLINNCEFTNNIMGVNGGSSNLQIVKNCLFQSNKKGYNYNGPAGITIESCIFKNNTVIALAIYNGIHQTNQISDCSIEDNEIGIECYHSPNIHDNYIVGNKIGIKLLGVSSNNTISKNVICNNSGFNIEYTAQENVNIAYNCFCSNDSSYISGTLHDGYDDITLGLLMFMPHADSLCNQPLSGINQVEIENELNIFPNPARNQVNFEFKKSISENYSISVYNSLGQLVFEQNSFNGNEKIDISGFSKGIYLINLTKRGAVLNAKKLVVTD